MTTNPTVLNGTIQENLEAYLMTHVLPEKDVNIRELSRSATHVEYDITREVPPPLQVFTGGKPTLTGHERAEISAEGFSSTTVTEVPNVCSTCVTCTYTRGDADGTTQVAVDIDMKWGERAPPVAVQEAAVAATNMWTTAAFDRVQAMIAELAVRRQNKA